MEVARNGGEKITAEAHKLHIAHIFWRMIKAIFGVARDGTVKPQKNIVCWIRVVQIALPRLNLLTAEYDHASVADSKPDTTWHPMRVFVQLITQTCCKQYVEATLHLRVSDFLSNA